MQRVMVDNHRPSKDLLLQPLPLAPGLGPAAPGSGARASKRTSSFSGAAAYSASAAAIASASDRSEVSEAAGPKKGSPAKLSVALPTAPQLPANFPATPTAHMALSGGLYMERGAPTLSIGSSPSPGGSRVSGSGSSSPSSIGSMGPSPSAPGSGTKRLSHLSEVGHAGDPLPLAPLAGAKRAGSQSGAAATAAGAGSPLRPSLRVAVPGEGDFHLAPPEPAGGSGDSIVYSPSTPAVKSGMKERMKFYFQRQAGQAGGL
jgi:hypothetical protein